MIELELKAVVGDVDAVREGLRSAGAVMIERGMLFDCRFDSNEVLRAQDQVLRVRRSEFVGTAPVSELCWKGPTRVVDGLKAREEYQTVLAGGAPVETILAALGYHAVHAIDRWIETWELGGATGRLEWYPGMDTLIEVEGSREGIERMIAASGIPAAGFSAEPLAAFVARFERRTGERARLDLGGGPAPEHWPR